MAVSKHLGNWDVTNICHFSAQIVPTHVSAATTTALANDVSNMAQQIYVSTAYGRKGRKESKGVHINASLRRMAMAVSVVRVLFSVFILAT
jgi:hypothetical protein